MIIRPGMTLWCHIKTPHISGASARKSSIPKARRLIQPGGGSWNGGWHGSPAIEASSFGMRKRPLMSWAYSNWPVPCCGCDAGHALSVVEIVS